MNSNKSNSSSANGILDFLKNKKEEDSRKSENLENVEGVNDISEIKTPNKYCSLNIYNIRDQCESQRYRIIYKETGLVAANGAMQGPSFVKEPPDYVDFSNMTGVTIECAASGHPTPQVTWVMDSGDPVTNLPEVRQVLPGGELVFPAFKAEYFRQDVHAAIYRCLASNAAGTILSRVVHVRAVVPQSYEIQVYDVYAIVQTTAVLKCHVPSFLEEHVRVTMWLRDEVLIIEPNGIMDGKYAVLPSGELHIREVTMDDTGSSYRCHVKHRLTGETHFSSASGRLYVTDPQGTVSPRITDIRPAVHVSEGATVILPCVAQGHPAPRAEWFAKLNKRQLFPLHIGERVQQTSGALIIHRAQTSDSGTYVCDVSNEAGSERGETTVTVTAPLSVTVSPEEQVVDIGKTATFRCIVSGFPVTTVTWYKDGKKVPTEGGGKTTSDEIIHIESIHVTDKGMYQCIVNNALESAQGAGQLILGDAAPQFMGVFEDQTFQPGSDASLKCVAIGSPAPRISWSLDGLDLKASSRLVMEETTDEEDGSVASLLNVTEAQWEDGGAYRCTATNKAGQTDHTARLNIYGRPAIRSMGRVTTIAGDDIRLNCPYYGYPIDAITWEKDGRPMPYNLRQVAFPNGTVLIRKVQRASDTGKYSCAVSNSQGQSAQEHIDLAVMVPPKITPFSFQDELVREGMRARLQCVVSEGDAPLRLRWTKDGQPLEAAAQSLGVLVRDLDEYSSILSISHVTPRHNGNYTCIATNEAAAAQHTTELSVNVPPKIIPFAFLDDQFYMGMRAHITCAISQGDLPIRFRWLKDGHVLPPDLGVVTRDYDQHANSLHIESVTSKHTGNYTCIATNAATSVNYSAPLLVHVAPKIVPFSFQSDHLFEGVLARISCVVYQGDLPLQIQWSKDGRALAPDLGAIVRELDDYSSILTIDSVERRHSGNYSCIAQNSAATVNYTAELVVNVPPKIVPFTFQDEHLLDGMLVRVSCVVSRGDLPLAIHWQKDSKPLPPHLGVTVREFDEYSSVLSIDPLSPAHSGNYTCIASNHAATATFTAPLVVYVPPRWKIEPGDVAVLLGHQLLIDCQADGFPKPKVTWVRTRGATVGEHVDPVESSADIRIMANGSLYIEEARESHRGHYFCKASNGIGDGLSTAVLLGILVPPRFDVKFRNQTLMRSEGFRLECPPAGDTPMTFSWRKDGTALDPQLDIRYQTETLKENSVSVLTVEEASRVDTGVYTCAAKNSYGSDEATMQITVFEPPDAPGDIRVREIRSRSAEVTWSAPFDGHGRISKYVIEYSKDEFQDALADMAVSGWNTSATLHGLAPASHYHVRLFAENDFGLSIASDILKFVTSEEAPAGPPLDVEADAVDANTVIVRWKPPKPELWMGKLRGFYVGYKLLDSSPPYTFQVVKIGEEVQENYTSYVSELRKYTKYSVIVAAYTDQGRGPPSEEVLVMTSEDVPGQPPMDVRCTPLTSQSIHVTWQHPPPHTLNGILRGYKVLYVKAEEVIEDVPLDHKITTVVRTTLHGLEKYTNYSIRVVAFTKVGDGVASTPIFCRSLDDVPDVPADVKAVPASKESVLVAWKTPLHSNGVVTKYHVYAKHVDDAEEDAIKHTVPPTALYYELPGLKTNQPYEFWVTAATLIGESPRSKMVSEAPQGPIVPARIAAFSGVITTYWKKYIKLPCKAVGNPAPERVWTLGAQAVKESDRLRVLPDGTLMVKNVQWSDSGNYTCRVKNGFGLDHVIYCVNVLAPPSAPAITVTETSATSIVLEWKLETDGGTNVQGYTLNYKREFSHWEQIDLAPDSSSYSLSGLKCGSQYQMYMTAFNKIGIGSPSEVISVGTNGTIPEIPDKDVLIDADIGYITLNLQSWNREECPISNFVIEYRPKSSTVLAWQLLADELKGEQENFVIRELQPGTPYDLRITAHNGAGSAVATYDFMTLSRQGDTVSPHNRVPEETRGILFYLDLRIIIPVAILVFIVVLILSVMCICANRRDNAARKMKGVDGHAAHNGPTHPGLRTDSAVNSFSYTQRHRSSTDGSILRPDLSQEKPVPYSTYHLPNLRSSAEFKTFGPQPRNNIIETPPPANNFKQAEVADSDANNTHALQHFSRSPQGVNGQSYPSPNGKRTVHPVAIPTAPPMADTTPTSNTAESSPGSPALRRLPEVPPKPNLATMETRFCPSPTDKVKCRVITGPQSGMEENRSPNPVTSTPDWSSSPGLYIC